MVQLLNGVLDAAIQVLGDPDRGDEVAAARKQFDDRRGRVFEDEDLWEAWTNVFLEWCTLERKPTVAGQMLAVESDPDRAAALRAWLRSMRTLVEVLRIEQGRVEALDLLGGAQFWVSEQRKLPAVTRGDVAEVRLVGFDGAVRFGRTFYFHPTGTRDAIVRRIDARRAAGDSRDDILDHFARLRLRCERYSHMTPARIYASTDDRVPHVGERA